LQSLIAFVFVSVEQWMHPSLLLKAVLKMFNLFCLRMVFRLQFSIDFEGMMDEPLSVS
jgi:hypothetical protein